MNCCGRITRVVQIAQAILTTTCSPIPCSPVLACDWTEFYTPPLGCQHSNSPPTCSADTYFFQSIEPFTRLTVATRHQRGGAGFPPGTPCHAGEATFQRQKSFSTYRESSYMAFDLLTHAIMGQCGKPASFA